MVGVKITLKGALCPGLSMIGRLGAVTVNPVPVAAALDIVILVPPVFVTVAGTV